MEIQQAPEKKFILNYGVLLGIISIVLGVVMYVTNAYLNPSMIYTIIGFLVLIVVISMGIKAFKNENGGFLNLKEAIKVGIGIAVIGGILSALWTLLLVNVIEPDFMLQMSDVQREQMTERFPEMTETQLDNAMEMSSRFMSPWFTVAVSLIGNLFFGLIIALIAGLIMKQERPYDV